MATKYVTKDLLLNLNERAIRNNKNRTLTDEFLGLLPDGSLRYPIMFTMSHNDFEVRAMIGVIVDHQVQMVCLDIALDAFNGIPAVEDTVAATRET